MQIQQWLESVRIELRRRHLPAAYIDRLSAELLDHAEDLASHAAPATPNATIELTLGTPRDIAQSALIKFRQTHFAGRHPFLVFALLPLPLAIIVFIALIFALAVPMDYFFAPIDQSLLMMQTIRFAFVFLPILLPALWLSRIARRSATALHWRAIAFLLLALCASTLYSTVLPSTPTSPGHLSIGLNYPKTPLQFLQLTLPLTALALSYRRQSLRPHTSAN